MRIVLVSICLAMALSLNLPVATGAVISVDNSDYTRSDVNFRPMFPVQGEEALLSVSVHNRSDREIEGVRVKAICRGSTKPIGERVITLPRSGAAVVEMIWTPEGNGWHYPVVTIESSLEKVTVNAEVPVIARKLYFPWFGGRNRQLRYANIVMAQKEQEQQDYWIDRGALLCQWRGVPKGITAEQYKEGLYKGLPESKAKGILIDEIGGYSDYDLRDSQSLAGLRLFTQEHPEVFVGLWVCGSLKPSVANIARNASRKSGVNLLMLESYFTYQLPAFSSYTRYAYFDQRINMARDYDVLTNSVMTLGIVGNADHYQTTAGNLEDQVRYIRRMAPEMPGIGFYSDGSNLAGLADSLCLKYFIRPVITLWERDIEVSNSTPVAGEAVTITATIYNIGGMDAGNVRVNLYRGDPRYGGRRIASKRFSAIPADRGVPLRVPTGKAIVEATWKALPGYHDIFVEVIPEDRNATLLDGLAKRTLYVQPAPGGEKRRRF